MHMETEFVLCDLSIRQFPKNERDKRGLSISVDGKSLTDFLKTNHDGFFNRSIPVRSLLSSQVLDQLNPLLYLSMGLYR